MVSFFRIIVLLVPCISLTNSHLIDEVVERGRTIADATSGNYYLLSPHVLLPVSDAPPRCPHVLKFILEHEVNQQFQLPLPIGLLDPSGNCTKAANFKPVNLKLMNYGQTIGAISVVLTKKALLAHQTYLTGNLPTGALRCGNNKEFVRITVLSLKGPVASLLRVLLDRVGVPQATLDKTLSGKQDAPEWVSDSDWKVDHLAVEDEAWEVKSALRPLETSFVMVIGTNHTLGVSGQSFPLASLLKEACVYTGGRDPPKTIALRILKLLKALLPVMSQANLPPISLAPLDYYSKSSCNDDVMSPPIYHVSIFPHNTTSDESLYDVAVNGGNRCAVANFSRLVKVEKMLNATTNGQPIVALAEEMMKYFEYHGVASSLFNMEGMHETSIVNYFPDIVRAVAQFEFKSKVFVAQVNLSTCSGFEKAEEATMLLVNRPSVLLDCGDGTASRTCFARSTNHHGMPTVRLQSDETTVLMTRGYNESSCILTSVPQT